MNERFANLLRINGWERREQQQHSYVRIDYIKPITVNILGTPQVVPISVEFSYYNTEDCPRRAILSPSDHVKLEIHPAHGNLSTTLKGAGRVIVCLESAGLMTALKYSIYCFSVNRFVKPAKIILETSNALPK